jgi:hypothetical protein
MLVTSVQKSLDLISLQKADPAVILLEKLHVANGIFEYLSPAFVVDDQIEHGFKQLQVLVSRRSGYPVSGSSESNVLGDELTSTE